MQVIVGSGPAIHSILFGAAPTAKEAAAKRVRQAWSSRRKVQGIAKAFGIPARLEVNNKAVREAVKAAREAGV